MTPGPGFDLAVALLFAVPGPTNALIAVAGARNGVRALPALVGAALVGFVAAVAALIGLAGPYVAATPVVGLALRALCALLLARSAWLLWRSAGASGASRDSTSAGAVLATTLVNPKALIFAFAIFPPLASVAESAEVFARFAVLAVVGMTLWGLAGAALGRGATARIGAATIDRAGAAVLAAFSVVVVAMGLAG
jgi:threonine/homoserine/homoserine lactone efflux protein